MSKEQLLKTKAAILQGLAKTHEVPFEEYGIAFTIRPLRDSEEAEIEAVEMEAINFDMGDLGKKQLQHMKENDFKKGMKFDLNMDKLMKAEREARNLTLKFGLDCGEESWTLDEIAELPSGVKKKLEKEIKRISGIKKDQRELTEFFREDIGGSEDLPEDTEGTTTDNDSE